MHKVIIIPGLGDHVNATAWAVKHWKDYGLTPVIYPMFWNDGKEFKTKLGRLLGTVDECVLNGTKISLVGCSAGASAALNVFCERKDKINTVISICGRLKAGGQLGFRSLENRSKKSPAFKQSVEFFETRQGVLSAEDRQRIMTVSAKFGDELVPSGASTLKGAYNITIPTVEHTISIYGALAIFSRQLISFLINKK